MHPKRTPLMETAQKVVQWLRAEDWMTRHKAFRRLADMPHHFAVVEHVRAQMGPDELCNGRGSAVFCQDDAPIALRDRKRSAKQTKIPDFFKRAKQVEKAKQKKLPHYFSLKQR